MYSVYYSKLIKGLSKEAWSPETTENGANTEKPYEYVINLISNET